MSGNNLGVLNHKELTEIVKFDSSRDKCCLEIFGSTLPHGMVGGSIIRNGDC